MQQAQSTRESNVTVTSAIIRSSEWPRRQRRHSKFSGQDDIGHAPTGKSAVGRSCSAALSLCSEVVSASSSYSSYPSYLWRAGCICFCFMRHFVQQQGGGLWSFLLRVQQRHNYSTPSRVRGQILGQVGGDAIIGRLGRSLRCVGRAVKADPGTPLWEQTRSREESVRLSSVIRPILGQLIGGPCQCGG